MAHSSRHRFSVRRLYCEQFESRLCLSGVSFADHVIAATETRDANSVFAADLDGDGDVDVLSASDGDDKIAWYENVDGKGTFGLQQVITTSAHGAESVHAADIDGDGDLDVLAAFWGSAEHHNVEWFENTNGKGDFGPKSAIGTSQDWATSVFATDLDGDGDMDVLSASRQVGITWYENLDSTGTFSQGNVITTMARRAESVYAADLDGDGDMDVLSASGDDNKLAWYENTDGEGAFSEQKVITTRASGTYTVYAADLDSDGDMDVLGTISGNIVAWFENTNGKGLFGKQRVVTRRVNWPWSVYASDLDGDGDMDVLSASGPFAGTTIAWYENTDGKGTFGSQQTISTISQGVKAVFAADVDGDGDMDVLSASRIDNLISWHENTEGTGDFGPLQEISRQANGADSVQAADLDGDGDMDVLAGLVDRFEPTIGWYENTDGNASFGRQQTISTLTSNANSGCNCVTVHAADVDRDGDMDVLAALGDPHDMIVWYENTDGKGTFGPQKIIATAVQRPFSVHTADIDGDGDMDVLSASSGPSQSPIDDIIAWYENTNGKGSFGPQQIISTPLGARWVFPADVDGDGDSDVLSTDRRGSAWYENVDGKGSFGPRQVITVESTRLGVADFDGDGDVDVLPTGLGDRIAWYRNSDGKGHFEQVIIDTMTRLAFAADMDSDGDMDILSTVRRSVRWSFAWYENTDGRGTFGDHQVIVGRTDWGFPIFVAEDLDSDGDVDFLFTSSRSPGGVDEPADDRISWYENISNVCAGDANRDLQFDQIDIVQVLQAAKYLTGERATFEEGDWNGDGLFDQLDIVDALETGNYLQGRYATATADAVFSSLDDST